FVDALDRHRVAALVLEAVYADHNLLQPVHRLLEVVGRILDLLLDVAQFDRAERAAQQIDFGKVGLGTAFDLIGQRLDVVGAGQRIDGVRRSRLIADDLLRAQGNARGFFRGQAKGFVVAVGVKRLRATQYGGQRLQSGADNVVLRLLRGERGAGGLRVETQHQRARIPGAKALLHGPRPHTAGRAELGDLF